MAMRAEAGRAAGFSESELNLAGMLADIDVGGPSSPSHALIARILKEDRVATPDADLQSLLHALESQERQAAMRNDITIRIDRDIRGGAGFAFDCTSLKITAIKKDRPELSAMQLGDVIVAVNGNLVASAPDYHKIAKGAKHFRLTLRRVGNVSPLAQVKPVPKIEARAKTKASAKGAAKAPARPPRGPSAAERQAMVLDVDNMSYEELLALDDVLPPVKKSGLNDTLIRQLPVELVCGGGGECSICLEEYYDGDAVTCLPCSHMFHVSCAREWLKVQSRCPYCNLDLT